MRFWRPAIGGLAAIAFTVAAVWVNFPEHVDPATNIAYVRGGTIDNLVIVDDDFDRWYVARVRHIRPTDVGNGITFRYYTGTCEKDGLVGYAIVETDSNVTLTVVAGQSGDDCADDSVPHPGLAPLAAPLGVREVNVVKPTTRQ